MPDELLADLRTKALLDWHDRGQPDGEIDTSGAPEMTAEQLAQLQPARLKIG